MSDQQGGDRQLPAKPTRPERRPTQKEQDFRRLVQSDPEKAAQLIRELLKGR